MKGAMGIQLKGRTIRVMGIIVVAEKVQEVMDQGKERPIGEKMPIIAIQNVLKLNNLIILVVQS